MVTPHESNHVNPSVSTAPPTATTLFSLSDNAAKRINFLKQREGKTDAKLRIQVLGGGCSGFQYRMDFDTVPQEGDHVFAHQGAEVVIDGTSLPFLQHSILDYEETLGSAMFVIKNPNTTAKCGCGNSFSV